MDARSEPPIPRRDVFVQVRLTPRERARWRAAAVRDELRLSEFVRLAVRARIEKANEDAPEAARR
jgi:hypothetical protein